LAGKEKLIDDLVVGGYCYLYHKFMLLMH